MANIAPFNPAYNTSFSVTSGASATSNIPAAAKQLALTNLGTSVVYVRISDSSNAAFTASAADYPVPPGIQVVITKGDGQDRIAIFGTGAVLHVCPGEGF